jgi:hypothetical protein
VTTVTRIAKSAGIRIIGIDLFADFRRRRRRSTNLAAELPLKAINFPALVLYSLLCSFIVRTGADKLGLFCLNRKHIASVIFNQLGVLVLQLIDLRGMLCSLATELLIMSSDPVNFSAELL